MKVELHTDDGKLLFGDGMITIVELHDVLVCMTANSSSLYLQHYLLCRNTCARWNAQGFPEICLEISNELSP